MLFLTNSTYIYAVSPPPAQHMLHGAVLPFAGAGRAPPARGLGSLLLQLLSPHPVVLPCPAHARAPASLALQSRFLSPELNH